ncbi:MAG TPA: hypothetical protein VND99_02995 [Candidatus Acidoferrales bacterium]|nr:hypothetical protein [Candidatus Acidoferrales bacterium]
MTKVTAKRWSKIKKVNEDAVSEKRLKLKLALYFLIGLFFHILGLIAAGLWIKFRTKVNKGVKFKSLLLGFVITMLISLSGEVPFVQSQIKNIVLSKFPELKPIDQTLKSAYPNYNIGYNLLYNTLYTGSETKKSSSLTIELSSTRDLPHVDNEYNKVGKLVCTTLNKENKHIDSVGVHFSQDYKFLGITFYHYYYGYSATCKYWLNQK